MTGPLIERNVRPTVVEALKEARAVCSLGARQSGKSTLAREIAAHEHPAEYLTLDNDATRRSALEDPTGFIARVSGPAVIDEVQRAPDLVLAIKERLDTNNERGQFLLAGSANILTLPSIADALPGRVAYVRMWPFSQGELRGRRESFIGCVLAGEVPQIDDAEVGRDAYARPGTANDGGLLPRARAVRGEHRGRSPASTAPGATRPVALQAPRSRSGSLRRREPRRRRSAKRPTGHSGAPVPNRPRSADASGGPKRTYQSGRDGR